MESHGVTRLRLLGTPAIDGPGVDGQAVLKQPKRLLLLAYLAARGGFVTRDMLLGLFWPTLDEDRARRALSQALHFLRRTLGRRSIVRRGSTEIAIGPSVRCDLAEFETAIEQGSLDVALGLYEGDLLSGVIPPRTRELGGWLESERSRHLGLALGAARKLAEDAYQAHDLNTAIAWLCRALEISPYDESAHREYLSLLDEAGDATGALAAHEVFRTRLSEQFDLEPSEATVRVVNLIRGRRPAVHAAARGPEPKTAPARPASAAADRTSKAPRSGRDRQGPYRGRLIRGPTGSAWRRVRTGVLAAIPLAAAVAGVLIWGGTSGVEPYLLVDNRVAVLYFNVNSDDEQLRYLADGLTEALINYLSQAKHLEVVSANGVRPFRSLDPSPDTLAARLRAKTIIDGTVTRSGRVTLADIRVNDGSNGSLITHIPATSRSADLLVIIQEILTKIGHELSPELGDVVNLGRWRAGTDNARALDRVLRAETIWKMADRASDSQDLPLARESYAAADALLREAILLDPDWPEPHVLRGDVALGVAFLCYTDPDCDDAAPASLDVAIAHAQSALELNQADPGALELKGRALLEKWSTSAEPDQEWLEEAEATLRGAVLLDDARADAWAALSAISYAKAAFDGAEFAAEEALEADAFLTNATEIQMRLFQSTFHGGHDIEASRWCDGVRARGSLLWLGAECTLNLMAWAKNRQPTPDSAWWEVERSLLHVPREVAAQIRPRLELLVASVLARAGLADSAYSVMLRAQSADRNDPDLLYYVAGVYAALGDTTKAFDHLSEFMEGAPPNRQHVARFRWFREMADLFDLPAVRPPT